MNPIEFFDKHFCPREIENRVIFMLGHQLQGFVLDACFHLRSIQSNATLIIKQSLLTVYHIREKTIFMGEGGFMNASSCHDIK